MLGYNKVIGLEDFADEDLRRTIRDVFAHEAPLFPANYPAGVEDSKQWEIAMTVRSLRDHGKLTRDARILGVGAGAGITSFYLTRHVNEVFATDLYVGNGMEADAAPAQFLVNPGIFSPMPFESDRLYPLHMDGRALRFPDQSFDGVYSSGSIEHFGSLDAVANSAYEIGRVLKPAGIASISTEFKLAGPPGSDGWDFDTILFTADKLGRYIIEASGLKPVDDPDFRISDATLSVRRDLSGFLQGTKGSFSPAKKIAHYPNLVLYHEGFLFCSIHLALRKDKPFPAQRNAWAAPSAALRASVYRSAPPMVAPGASLLSLLKDGASQTEADLRIRLQQSEAREAELKIRLAEIEKSKSWRAGAPLRAVSGAARRLRGYGSQSERRRKTQADLELVRSSAYFDAAWYLAHYADVAAAGVDAAEHYLTHGAYEGRNPGPRFDSNWYLHHNGDVRAARMNPLVHYLRYGVGEGRPLAEGALEIERNGGSRRKPRRKPAKNSGQR